MQVPRLIIALVVLFMLLSVAWLSSRLLHGLRPAAPPAVATVAPSATVAATATPLLAPPGYRLAGVAVGEPESFAVIEAPSGTTTLYKLNSEIPGLGRLIRIDAERVLIESATGQFELWLAPGATPTATKPSRPTRTSSSARTPTPAPPRAPDDGRARGSAP